MITHQGVSPNCKSGPVQLVALGTGKEALVFLTTMKKLLSEPIRSILSHDSAGTNISPNLG